jgi:hypothetical protein
MSPALNALALSAALIAWPAAEAPSYLFRLQRDGNDVQWHREPYRPRAGDVVLYDAKAPILSRLYRLIGTDGPLHAGIVFRRPDGSCALLEAGPNLVPRVFVLDVDKRMREYEGTVLVRRLRKPLDEDASKKLTEFCLAQEGKSYAVLRVVLLSSPLRPRGWLQPYLGKTALDRNRWFCSELVVAAASAAGVLDPKTFHANAVFPRDLCFDETVNLRDFYEPPLLWYPQPRLDFDLPLQADQ